MLKINNQNLEAANSRIIDVDVAPQIIQMHVLAGQFDQFPIDVHSGQFRVGQQMAQSVKRRATGQSQHQNGSWRSLGM
jgi:hypothetical protein